MKRYMYRIIRNVTRLPVLRNLLKLLREMTKLRMHVYIGDLLQANNGIISSTQLIIVSRVIDLQQYMTGDYSLIWQMEKIRPAEHPQGVDEEWIRDQLPRWKSIIEELETCGFNPEISRIPVGTNNGAYFKPINGSHRIAWAFVSGNRYLPVEITKEVSGLPENGIEYFRQCGIKEDDIQELQKVYHQVMDCLENFLFCYLHSDNSKFKQIVMLLQDFGDLKEIKAEYVLKTVSDRYLPIYIREKLESLDNSNMYKDLKLYYFSPYQQELYFRKGYIHSYYIEKVIGSINRVSPYEAWGGICESVTESRLVKPQIEYRMFNEAKKII